MYRFDGVFAVAVTSAGSNIPVCSKKVERDIRTSPAPLKEGLGDIYGDSTEELGGETELEPLPATQGSILLVSMYSYTKYFVLICW